MKLIFLFIAICATSISAKLAEEDLIWGKNYDESMYFSKDYSQANSDSLDDNFDDISMRSADDVERLDCFGLPGKFINRFHQLPSNGTEALKTRFYLKTRGLSKRVEIPNGKGLSRHLKLKFDIKKTNVFITHGWLSGSDEHWVEKMENAFLSLVRF